MWKTGYSVTPWQHGPFLSKSHVSFVRYYKCRKFEVAFFTMHIMPITLQLIPVNYIQNRSDLAKPSIKCTVWLSVFQLTVNLSLTCFGIYKIPQTIPALTTSSRSYGAIKHIAVSLTCLVITARQIQKSSPCQTGYSLIFVIYIFITTTYGWYCVQRYG